ncbi:MAG: UDP-N-acetylmuramoyl-L-alanyl-D-glutamate--2,6-diaminopimelate ligase [Bacteroidota bacterium]|nr:UDP-N-acetylmuramoyl-L-alanyl-D-glutamate--2,6-diaminopimelate ligase [Bacteroidota bacterium]
MTLAKLLDGIKVSKMFRTLYGQKLPTQDIDISHIQYDSRKIRFGDLFIAIHGKESDGHTFIEQAITNGAKVVVVEDDAALPDSFFLHSGVVKIVVPNCRIALSQLSANYFDRPAKKMKMIGVTGTNGKTTTTHLIKSILEMSGEKTGLIGTIQYSIGDQILPATHTTPESLELNELLDRMARSGCSSVVMEVSSHALHQHRVDGIGFKAGVFTNLTQDHLDYHGSMDEYFKAKMILFENLSSDSWAIVNVDDEWGTKLTKLTKAKTITYGITTSAIVEGKNISPSISGLKFSIIYETKETLIESQLIGQFNVSNILAAYSVGIALGIPQQTICTALGSIKNVPGRFERIVSRKGWTAVIDYAHTPDALEKALRAIHGVFDKNNRGRIITVFGCGGNRDRGKRPKMGNIASSLSEITIITSDNPRNENPDLIINEIHEGIKSGLKVYREPDRRKAILMALDTAKSGDVVLIAGKGHEIYQVIKDEKIFFSDQQIVEEYIRADESLD